MDGTYFKFYKVEFCVLSLSNGHTKVDKMVLEGLLQLAVIAQCVKLYLGHTHILVSAPLFLIQLPAIQGMQQTVTQVLGFRGPMCESRLSPAS